MKWSWQRSNESQIFQSRILNTMLWRIAVKALTKRDTRHAILPQCKCGESKESINRSHVLISNRIFFLCIFSALLSFLAFLTLISTAYDVMCTRLQSELKLIIFFVPLYNRIASICFCRKQNRCAHSVLSASECIENIWSETRKIGRCVGLFEWHPGNFSTFCDLWTRNSGYHSIAAVQLSLFARSNYVLYVRQRGNR